MPIQRDHFRERFHNLPNWVCPRCEIGTLQELVTARTSLWPQWSKAERDEDWYEPEHSRQRFAAQLQCNNSVCGEQVLLIGQSIPRQFEDHEVGVHYSDELQPKAAFPPIPVFRLSEDWPGSVRTELTLAFASLWGDPGASANRLRTAVERLLDNIGVRKTTMSIKSGKTRRVKLKTHDRIVAFRAQNPKAAAVLEAIKWLGNSGSHADLIGLTREQVLDGMALMEHALHLLFDKTDAQVLKLAKGINKKKGPLKPKKVSKKHALWSS